MDETEQNEAGLILLHNITLHYIILKKALFPTTIQIEELFDKILPTV
jgi:hypothetical protein